MFGPMFGASTAGPAASVAAAPSLFGTQPGGGGIQQLGFGSASRPAATAAPAPVSLFGAQPAGAATTMPSQPGFFGAAISLPQTAATSGPAAASNTIAASAMNQQASNAATTAITTITPKSKYSDLPENVRQQIDLLEKFIQSQIHLSESIGSAANEERVSTISAEAQMIAQRLSRIRNLLIRDEYVMAEFKKEVQQELRNTDLASRFIDRVQVGEQPKFTSVHSDAYINYFITFTENLEKRMQICRQSIEEIDANVRSMMSARPNYTPKAIESTIRAQHDAFISIANKVSLVHEEVDRCRHNFERFHQRYYRMTPALSTMGAPSSMSSSSVVVPGGGDRHSSLSSIAQTTLKPVGAGGPPPVTQPVQPAATSSLARPGGGFGASMTAPTTQPGGGLFGGSGVRTTAAAATTTTAAGGSTMPSFSLSGGFGGTTGLTTTSAVSAATTTAAPLSFGAGGGFGGLALGASANASMPGAKRSSSAETSAGGLFGGGAAAASPLGQPLGKRR